MPTVSYLERRKELETYFDRTAADAWARLTSDAPLGRIRATVREGRELMRKSLLDWLPEDLTGRRILDAGCGTGGLAVALATRGADVLAVDISPNLVALARERHPARIGKGSLSFEVGDMLKPVASRFDHICALDSLIHYNASDVAKSLGLLSRSATSSMLFTFVPRTPMLVAMHAAGRLFPRTDRAPALRPLGEAAIRSLVSSQTELSHWQPARTAYVSRGFYTSQALELVRS